MSRNAAAELSHRPLNQVLMTWNKKVEFTQESSHGTTVIGRSLLSHTYDTDKINWETTITRLSELTGCINSNLRKAVKSNE